eukprot:SAG25_NODE_313_length_9986_cov_6.931324_2_plen_82_part_00
MLKGLSLQLTRGHHHPRSCSRAGGGWGLSWNTTSTPCAVTIEGGWRHMVVRGSPTPRLQLRCVPPETRRCVLLLPWWRATH